MLPRFFSRFVAKHSNAMEGERERFVKRLVEEHKRVIHILVSIRMVNEHCTPCTGGGQALAHFKFITLLHYQSSNRLSSKF